MIIPQHWAEAKIKTKIAGRQYSLKRFGWSNQDLDAAQAHAEQRLAEAIAKIKAGENIHRIDHKVAYNGAEGLPIREEIIAQHDDVIITRNAYGALCLNTPDVLFADIDFIDTPSFKLRLIAFLILLLSSIAAATYLMSWLIFGIGAVITLLFTGLLTKGLARIQTQFAGRPEQLTLKRIQQFSAQHPSWHLRVYRTPKGYRILVMHQIFQPNGDMAQLLFDSIQADPNYVRMCKNQNCFRARISPKPWRIGINRLRLGVWPVSAERQAIRAKWVQDYQRQAEHYASCRFVAQLGSQAINLKAKRVQSLHDQYCKSNSSLDIA
ncbi:hypothetical protein F889_03749 [Acinetobacter colistiniresistens]|uniref:Transmembrane protein n=1 Tax=Acinetobacter colistiniresistens TaxID=280145 RepID=N9PE45_9GAMM|nr:hypothetical protein [Acinetobacter colistiniresistens]ENX31859.1 hypothetical protein F889_03749 [Acinetobacter colistiniresistens]